MRRIYLYILFLCLLLAPLKVNASDLMGVSDKMKEAENYTSSNGVLSFKLEGKLRNESFKGEMPDGNKINIFEITGNTQLRFYVNNYKKLKYDKQKEVLTRFRDSDIYTSMTALDKETFTDMIHGVDSDTTSGELLTSMFGDVEPDLYEGYKMYKPMEGLVGTILGVFAIILIVGVVVTITLDIAYITLEPVKAFMVDKDLRIVSKQTEKLVSMYEDKGSGILLFKFLQYKGVMIFALVLCIYYLVDGQSFIIVGKLIDLFKIGGS